jgi:hypothetical protein
MEAEKTPLSVLQTTYLGILQNKTICAVKTNNLGEIKEVLPEWTRSLKKLIASEASKANAETVARSLVPKLLSFCLPFLKGTKAYC